LIIVLRVWVKTINFKLTDAAVEESKKAAEKAASDAANAVNSTVDNTLKRVEQAADEGIKNAGHVVDSKIKDADKYLSDKRDTVSTVNRTSDYTLWTLCRSYFNGISANMELRVYSVTWC
jgi:cell division septum initiation protein DivIVA